MGLREGDKYGQAKLKNPFLNKCNFKSNSRHRAWGLLMGEIDVRIK